MRRAVVAVGAVFTVMVLASPAQAVKPGGGGGGGGGKAIVHKFSLSATTMEENLGGPYSLTIQRSGNLKCPSVVSFATANGTATAADDYFSASGPAVFNKNQTEATIFITLKSDAVSESNETFTVSLNTPTTNCKGGATATVGSPGSVTVTVTDGDLTLSVPDGDTVTVSDMLMFGCNEHVAHLLTSSGTDLELGTRESGCNATDAPPNQEWANTTGGSVTIRLALEDVDCQHTYYSDTTGHDDLTDTDEPYNHAWVTPGTAGNYQVGIDGGGDTFCGVEHLHTAPSGGGAQFQAHVRIWTKPAASDGSVTIDPGNRAHVTYTVNACNDVVFYYLVDGAESQFNATNSSNCSAGGDFYVENTTTDPAELMLKVFDTTCDNASYFSDGTGTADHAVAYGENPMLIDIRDAGGICERRETTSEPTSGQGNLSAQVDVEPIPPPD